MANPQPDEYTKFSNELLEIYISITRFLSPYENAVWLCIFRKTYGYHKKIDWISLKQVEEMTGIRQPHVARTKKKLLLKNMIVSNKGVGIQKDYEKWYIPKQVYPIRYIPKQDLPKQVSGLTQTGNKNLPKQVDTKEIKETITKESSKGSFSVNLTDIEFIKYLKNNIAYKHINIDTELAKIDAWLLIHKGKQKTKRFILNWLNRIDKPLEPQARKP